MQKNVAGQKVGVQMVSATDGSAFTGSVTVAVTVDAGTQATGSVGSGACTHEGGGYHSYAPAQAETNGDLVAFTFSGTGAVPETVQIYTRAATPDVNVTQFGGSAVTAASGIPEVKVASIAAGAVNAAAIGTDAIDADSLKADAITEIQSGLATASALATVAGYLDTEIAAILAAVDTEVAAILAATNELQTDLTDGGRLDLILDAINAKTTNLPSDPADASVIAGRFDTLDTAVGDIPTNAELATALAAADDAVLAAIAALNNLSSVQAQAAAAAALTATVADSIPADGTRPSIASGILMLTRFLFERVVTTTTVSVKKEDGSTEAMTFQLNDADEPSSITRAS